MLMLNNPFLDLTSLKEEGKRLPPSLQLRYRDRHYSIVRYSVLGHSSASSSQRRRPPLQLLGIPNFLKLLRSLAAPISSILLP
eukprot:SAG11_NODE_14138_length_623_cov_3.545802_1_plen_82_part_01